MKTEGFLAWQCQPRDPTRDRGDGCSIVAPAEGAACATKVSCEYNFSSGCTRGQTTYECTDHGWTVTRSLFAPVPG